jgi:heterodisulfide reductase subunit A
VLLGRLIEEVAGDPSITIHTSAEITGTSGNIGNFHLTVRLHPRGIGPEFDLSRMREVAEVCPETSVSDFDYGLLERKAIYMPYNGCYPPMPAIDWETCTRCGECVEAVRGAGVSLHGKPREIDLNVGSFVLATGFDPYEPRNGEFGYGMSPRVLTLPQFVRLMEHRKPGRPEIDSGPLRHVCLIHCVGSRQIDGVHPPGPDGKVNDYCSRTCCTATLQAACEIRERFPDINVYDFYQDIRTYGRGHEEYYERASRLGVLFFRWQGDSPPVVEIREEGHGPPLAVRVRDMLTFGEEVEVPADLVVLSSGMMPRDIDSLVDMLKLPRSADRFLQEVHPKLRPVEMAVGGVMIAGTCQAPMDIGECAASASAAAVKASAMLAKGFIELEPFVAVVDSEACTGGDGCDAICVSECDAVQAITLVETEVHGMTRKVAEVNTVLCNGCGMCVAVCPHRAVDVAGWRIDQFEAMVDAIAMTGEGS